VFSWFRELDRVLRGERTRLDDLQQGTVPVPAAPMLVVIVVLALANGACMGSFAVWRETGPVWGQLAAATLKTPALFLLTLGATFPSLYVFNALVGSRLNCVAVFRLRLASLGVLLAVLASLGPIVAYFGASTTRYRFMVLLNIAAFAAAGGLGMKFLRETLHRLTASPAPQPPAPPPPEPQPPEALPEAPPEESGPLARREGHVLGRQTRAVFTAWILVFGLVGAQMSWFLRPFTGNPDEPFTRLRPRGSNFFVALVETIRGMFGL
jgi:hypothetical protein